MAKKAKKKVAAKAATRSKKTKKVIAVKTVKAKKPAPSPRITSGSDI